MRARLILLLMLMMSATLLALGIPLANAIRNADTHDVFVDRLNDTALFASIAEQADTAGMIEAIRPELQRYQEVYGIGCVILAPNHEIRLTSAPAGGAPVALPADAAARMEISNALGGRRSESAPTTFPWQGTPMVVAEPIVHGGDVVGAVVTVSPTGELRHRVAVAWALLLLAGVAALVAGYFAADRLARWVLRPVRELDATTQQVATGRFDARVPVESGPPELRRLAASFNNMADHVELSLERQRAFVADASHQLRNPLAALLLRLDDLASRADPDIRADAELAMEEGRRLVGVLERLLELARAENSGDSAELCALQPIVAERIAGWLPIASARRIDLRQDGASGVLAWAEPSAIEGALDVLVDNALKFSPEGSRVQVRVFTTDTEAIVSVRDQGPGLAPDELSRAGDRFWRGRSQQNAPGYGLGLSIARALLQPAGGRLQLVSPPEGGLDVRLLLRRTQLTPSNSDTTPALRDAAAPAR